VVLTTAVTSDGNIGSFYLLDETKHNTEFLINAEFSTRLNSKNKEQNPFCFQLD